MIPRLSSVKLSEDERAFIARGVAANVRADGRKMNDGRVIEIQSRVASGVASFAECAFRGAGAARSTRASCAIALDIVKPKKDAPGVGAIEINVDASLSVKDGARAAEASANERYAEVLRELVCGHRASAVTTSERSENEGESRARGAIDLERLCIKRGRAAWTLRADVAALSDRGSMIDAMSIALRAALAEVRIPRVTVAGVGDGEEDVGELEVDDDPDACERIDVGRVGVVVTATKIGRYSVIDATDEEESCGDYSMSVAVDREGAICGEFSSGSEGLDRGTATAMRTLARRVGVEVIEKMDAYLASAAAHLDAGDDDNEDDEDSRVIVVRLPEE